VKSIKSRSLRYRAISTITAIFAVFCILSAGVYAIEKLGYFAAPFVLTLSVVVGWFVEDIAMFVAKRLGKK
jgi:hypothetical protein